MGNRIEENYHMFNSWTSWETEVEYTGVPHQNEAGNNNWRRIFGGYMWIRWHKNWEIDEWKSWDWEEGINVFGIGKEMRTRRVRRLIERKERTTLLG